MAKYIYLKSHNKYCGKDGVARSCRTREPRPEVKRLLRPSEATVISNDPDLRQYGIRIYAFPPTNLTVAAEAIRDYPLAHRLYVAALLVFIFQGTMEREKLKKEDMGRLLRNDISTEPAL